MSVPSSTATEQDIAELVARFYARARENPTLQPIFDGVVHDWDEHLGIIQNFWSWTLLGTDRYHGHPYPVHAQLPLKPEHFDIWLDLFRQTAKEVLSEHDAACVIERAEHMAESFRAGMFSFPDYKGPKLWKPA